MLEDRERWRDREHWKKRREAFKEDFEGSFPHGHDIMKFLRASDVTLNSAVRDGWSPSSWHLFCKPGSQLQEMFGCKQEILLHCSPFEDLQSRSIEAIEGKIRRSALRLDGDIALLITPDPSTMEKVRNFNTTITVVPFCLHEITEPTIDLNFLLRHRMAEVLYPRNLYDETTPVDGARFFGRKREVVKCIGELKAGRQVGIFGLRKIGKTSLVHEAQKQLQPARDSMTRVAYIDLQQYSLTKSIDRLLFDIGREFFGEPGTRYQKWLSKCVEYYSHEYEEIPPGTTTSRFPSDVALMCEIFGTKANEQQRLILILDEIEYLIGTQVHPGFPEGIAFMRTWRGLCQQHNVISTAVVGVNSTIIEQSKLQGQENPLFKFFRSFYLPALTEEESKRMVQTIGRKIGMSYSHDCHEYLFDRLAGHPFLTRQFCATVAEQYPKRPVSITPTELEASSGVFLRKHSSVFRQVFEILDDFYPEESKAMELVALGEPCNLKDIVSAPEAIEHLIGCTLLATDEGETRIPIGFLREWIVENRIGV